MAKKAPIRDLNKINIVIIHHSATNPGAVTKEQGLARARTYDTHHSNKSYAIETDGKYGFKFISYHYMITRDGTVIQLQDIKFMRIHAGESNANAYGIGILLDGNFDVEVPSSKQISSAISLINKLNAGLGKRLPIKGHGEVGNTACPGKNMGKSTDGSGNLRTIINKTGSQKSLTGFFRLILELIRRIFVR